MSKTKVILDDCERQRLVKMMSYERKHYRKGCKFVAGVDEAGRGPLAGPVVAAVCILPKTILIPGIDDSKKLSPEVRDQIYEYLIGNKRIHFGIGIVDRHEIDRVNIYQATIQAMILAVQRLEKIPDYLLVDGLRLPHPTIPVEKIIKGDQLSQSIAAASILAKVTRDRMMIEFHRKWPEYGFKDHKGYGTKKHREALDKFGPCPIHRRSFKLGGDSLHDKQLELDFCIN